MKMKKISALALAGIMAAGIGLTGCGAMNPEDTVATVNGREISLGLANFAAQYTAVDYDSYMAYMGQNMWSSDPTGSGTTLTESVKEDTLERLEEYYLLEQHMSDYGVEITAEETAAIEKAAAQFIADNSEEALEAMGATQECVEEYLRLNTLQKKMRPLMVADVDTNVPDEECEQKTFSYVRISKAASGNDKQETDEKQAAAEAKKKAEKILKAALVGSQEDPLEAAAKDNDANKSTCSYGAPDLDEKENSTYLELEVLQAAEKLDEGEFAKNLIETDKYYYIIRMDSLLDKEATERERKSIISGREDDLYEEIVNGYMDDVEWTVNEDVWAPVNFDTIYKRVQAQTDTNTDAGE